MTNRTTAAYASALQYVNDNIIEINGSGIIIDFEKAMRAGLRKVSPNIPILGCWFHFAQAFRRKMASLTDLFTLVRENSAAKLIFRNFQCLSLLPYEKINDAFVHLLREALQENKMKAFAPFINYFKKEWIEIVKPEYFSVFDKKVRTTGSAEAFNGKLNKKFRTHPSFYNFVESLQGEELSKTDEFHRHAHGKEPKDTRKKFYVQREERIKEYSEKLFNSEINYKFFLNVMSNDENEMFIDDYEHVQSDEPKENEQQANFADDENTTDDLEMKNVRVFCFSFIY